MKAITCNTLIDGVADEPISDAVLIVDDGVVKQVGSAGDVQIPPDTEQIDRSDAVILPGLIDAHLHLHGVRTYNKLDRLTNHCSQITAHAIADLQTLLTNGFTSVRDLGS